MPSTRNPRVWVGHGNNDAARGGGDDRVDAGRGASVMRAGLEGDVDVGAAGVLTREPERFDLGVRVARFAVEPDGDRLTPAAR